MKYEETITTTAGTAAAWGAVAGATAWPQWTDSMTEVRPLDGDDPGLRVGGRFRVIQPGLPTVVWRITEVHDGQSFVWKTRAPGVSTVAFHRVDPEPDGTTRITIGIDQTGPLAWLIGAVLGAKTRRYLAMEAAGLKAASESADRGTG